MHRLALIALAAGILASAQALGAECGTTPDTPCTIGTGEYRIAVPETETAPGALVWLHGMGGTADGVMKNTRTIRTLAGRNMALIAPAGVISGRTGRFARNWAVRDGRDYDRDDVAFIAAVIEDAVQRHGIDPARILLGGFSRGGSMVWDVACTAPGTARAYAPVAGAFWEPMDGTCAAPVDLFHTHGWKDRTVPLEGRPLRNGTMIQGDVFQGLYHLRALNGCANRQPEEAVAGEDGIWTRTWSDCASGRQIELMLHPGGHGVPSGWLDRALDWFEARIGEEAAICQITPAAEGC